jgi:hypothetical protein
MYARLCVDDEATIKMAQKVGYMYVGPFILAIGIIGSLANLVTFLNVQGIHT